MTDNQKVISVVYEGVEYRCLAEIEDGEGGGFEAKSPWYSSGGDIGPDEACWDTFWANERVRQHNEIMDTLWG